MGPIASRLLLAIAIIGGHAVSSMAGEVAPGARLLDPALPAFVPPSGRGSFKTAVSDNSASAVAARRAAEALGAKFSDITTGSIAPAATTPAATPSPSSISLPSAETDPPHVVAPEDEGRSIVLSSRHGADAKTVSAAGKPKPQIRSKSRDAEHGTSRSAAQDRVGAPAQGSPEKVASLAAIGQKVGFVELLTNPALWHWPSGANAAKQP